MVGNWEQQGFVSGWESFVLLVLKEWLTTLIIHQLLCGPAAGWTRTLGEIHRILWVSGERHEVGVLSSSTDCAGQYVHCERWLFCLYLSSPKILIQTSPYPISSPSFLIHLFLCWIHSVLWECHIIDVKDNIIKPSKCLGKAI